MKNTEESARQFYELVMQDVSMQEQLKFASDEKNLLDLAVQLGKKNGYTFTADDLKSAISQEEGLQDVELSDALLEAVAGGKGATAS